MRVSPENGYPRQLVVGVDAMEWDLVTSLLPPLAKDVECWPKG